MAKVRFLSRQQPRTGRLEGDPVYEAGQVYDLRDDQARKWVNRNVAVYANEEKQEEKPEPTPDSRAVRGTDLDDPGVDTVKPDAMTTADIAPPRRHLSEEKADDGLDDMQREDLLALAEERGVELGSGYQKKENIIAALRDAQQGR